MRKYKVIQDTREKKPWSFPIKDYCEGSVVSTLKTGDYSIEGLENILCIERKRSTGEFCGNISKSRWDRELVRMSKFEHAYLILEFTADQVLEFPYGSGIPEKYWPGLKITGSFMMTKITSYMVAYPNIHIIFAGTQGSLIAQKIFKQVIEHEGV